MGKIYKFLRFSLPVFFSHPLWKTNPLHPLSRLIILQALFFIGKKTVYHDWVEGLKLSIKKGETSLTSNYYFELYEFDSMLFALHLLRQDSLFIDIGANLGSYAVLASGVTGCETLAFEPVPKTFSRLVENITLNKLGGRINAQMVALSSLNSRQSVQPSFFSIDKGAENSFVDKDYRGSSISLKVSSLNIESQNQYPVLIKMDIEGHEYEVIKGGSNIFLKKSLLAAIIENQSEEVSLLMREFGFTPLSYNGLNRKLQKDHKPNINQIWIKTSKIEEVKKRIRQAPVIRIKGKIF